MEVAKASEENLSKSIQGGITFLQAIPILRIFDEKKAREFYIDFLGFSVKMEHRLEANLPLYMGIERAGLELHLSEHYGDATPGSTAFIPMRGIKEFHAELTAKQYGFSRPGLESSPWGNEMELLDPFGNRLRFCEKV